MGPCGNRRDRYPAHNYTDAPAVSAYSLCRACNVRTVTPTAELWTHFASNTA